MNPFFKKIFLLLVFAFLANSSLYAQKIQENDSTTVKKDSIQLKYNFKKSQTGGLFLDYLAKK